VEDWSRINKNVPRLVSVLPNGPINYPTAFVFLAGGVPEVMLHLRKLGLLHLDVLTASGQSLNENLEWWEQSERRQRFKEILQKEEKINPDDVIFTRQNAREKKVTSTVTFPTGNLAPEGCLIKSTAIDPTVLDENGVYDFIGPARVFNSEPAAITAIKEGRIHPGDVMVLCCLGPMGSGMEETFQVTAALKYVSWGKQVALITDGRFSGVSTGACIGHIGPEALAGGPIGKIKNGDIIHIQIDTRQLVGSLNLVGQQGDDQSQLSAERGATILAHRQPRPDLAPQPNVPDDTTLWAALQHVSGGTWGGCVYDVESITQKLQ
jgi:putative YjhG/YagF family dehydratase